MFHTLSGLFDSPVISTPPRDHAPATVVPWSKQEVVPHDAAQEEARMMQGGLVGLLFLLAGGTSTLSLMDGPMTFEKKLLLSLVAGTLGALFGYCVSRPTCFQDMVRQAAGNIAFAIFAGPWLTIWLASRLKIDVTPEFVLAVTGTCGAGSVLGVRALWPVAIRAFRSLLPTLIAAWMGIETPRSKPRSKPRKSYPRLKADDDSSPPAGIPPVVPPAV